jgi:flagellar biosynthesis GTPase FlhF
MRKSGKFWVYEQGIQIPFYGIYEVQKASVEVYRLVSGQYEKMLPNHRNHYEIEPMGVELGIRYGSEEPPVPWLRWWDKEGNLLRTGSERAAQAEILAERERLIASQERLARQEAETIAAQERLAKQEAEAIAAQERLAKQEAEAIAAQERQQKEQERLAKQQAEAIAAQERLAKQEAEAIAAQERQQKEQERLAKQQAEAIAAQERLAKQEAEATVQAEREKNEKLVAYLRSIGVNPEAI